MSQYTEHIINSLPGIFYLFDTNGKFLLWNKNFEFVSGYNSAEVSTMHPLDFFEGEDKELIAERIGKVFKEGKSDAEAYFLSKDKQKIPFYFSGSLIQYENQTCLIGMGINTSERKEAEEKLKASEEKYRLIVETAMEGIWLIDENNATTFVNNQMASLLGYEREEMVGKKLHEFIEPNKWGHIDKQIENRRRGLSDQHEFLFRKKGGQPMWALVNTTPVSRNGSYKGALAMIADITSRKEIEEKLQWSEQKFKSLVQNSFDIISVVDSLGNYQYVSPAVTAILGYSPDFFLSKNAFQFIHPDDKEMVSEALVKLLNAQKVITPPYRFAHSNGEWRWLESHGTNMNDDPYVQGLIINTRDITDRKRLQEELDTRTKERQKEITAAVIQAQEKERSQLGQELHDNVNQVLTTVKLYNEMLRDGLGNPADLFAKSAQQLQNCIDEIRSISKRLSAPTLGKISLSESIKELVESINLTKRLKIDYQISGFVDKNISQDVHLGIYRIIQEQLNNIIKYAEASHVSIMIAANEVELAVTITDDGKGFNIHQKREGIGITNMISRAEHLNGRLDIRSELGTGCAINVLIPLFQ